MAPPIINAPTCGNCKHAVPDGSNLQCQFNPPTANALFQPDGKGGVKIAGVVSVFPVMGADQRCGQHQRAVVMRIEEAKVLAALRGS